MPKLNKETLPHRKELSEKLRQFILRRGITTSVFAEKTKLSSQVFSRIINLKGEKYPSIQSLEKVISGFEKNFSLTREEILEDADSANDLVITKEEFIKLSSLSEFFDGSIKLSKIKFFVLAIRS